MDKNTYNLALEYLPEPFTSEETIKKFIQMNNGNREARKELIEHNLRLVKSIAIDFSNKGIEFDEAFQAGCIGLINSVNNFNLSKNIAFSTFATRCIKNEIINFTKQKDKSKRDISMHQPIKKDRSIGKETLVEDMISDERQDFVDSKIEQTVVDSLINELDERRIKVLKLYYEEEYTQQEIAEMMDMTRQNVALILRSSKVQLAKKLKRIGYKRI